VASLDRGPLAAGPSLGGLATLDDLDVDGRRVLLLLEGRVLPGLQALRETAAAR